MHIDDYSFGHIVIDGKKYTKDVLVLPDKVIPNWWRKEGHIFDLDDCRDLIDCNPELIIFGLGAYKLVKLSPGLTLEIQRNNIQFEAAASKKACEIYNRKSDMKIAAGFHLTC